MESQKRPKEGKMSFGSEMISSQTGAEKEKCCELCLMFWIFFLNNYV